MAKARNAGRSPRCSLKSFQRPTVVSRSCMVNDMSSGKALGERERHLIVAETIGLPLVLLITIISK